MGKPEVFPIFFRFLQNILVKGVKIWYDLYKIAFNKEGKL